MPKNTEDDEPVSAKCMEDQWFSVMEPVTEETLIDTIITQLGTLTTLCSLLGNSDSVPPTSLAWIEGIFLKIDQVEVARASAGCGC